MSNRLLAGSEFEIERLESKYLTTLQTIQLHILVRLGIRTSGSSAAASVVQRGGAGAGSESAAVDSLPLGARNNHRCLFIVRTPGTEARNSPLVREYRSASLFTSGGCHLPGVKDLRDYRPIWGNASKRRPNRASETAHSSTR